MSNDTAANEQEQAKPEEQPSVDITVGDEFDDNAQPEPEEPKESPKQRAKRLRKLNDEELGKLEDAAFNAIEMIDLARRTQAEFDNYQKRAETHRRQELKFAASSLVRALLEPIDNLDRALAEAAKNEDFEALRKGVELTHKQILAALEKASVSVINPADEAFDPEFHEAVMTGAESDKDNNLVLDTFEKGWKLHDRVLRPAKVRVNKLD